MHGKSWTRVLALAWTLSFGLGPVEAAEIVVTTTSDSIGIDGQCTLREAIQAANTDMQVDTCAAGSGADTIKLQITEFTMAIPGTNEDLNQTGDFDIREDLTIEPMDPSAIAGISAGGLDRVFEVFDGADLTLSRIDVRGGNVIGFGGGILGLTAASEIVLESSRVTDNEATIFGGGIYSVGPLLIRYSVLSENRSTIGGGVYMSSLDPLTVESSRFFNNRVGSDGGDISALSVVVENSEFSFSEAGRNGGALDLRRQGSLAGTSQLTNCTITQSSSVEHGGGIYFNNSGTLDLSSVTIARNVSDVNELDRGDGAGLYVSNGTVRVWNSLIAENVDVSHLVGGTNAPDCFGPIVSLGYNLLGALDATDCPISGTTTGNLVGTLAMPIEPGINTLDDNGGPTCTMALFNKSPAVDAGDPAGCAHLTLTSLARDQRGHQRIVDSTDPDSIARCDIGAFEVVAPPFLVFSEDFESGVASRFVANGAVASDPLECNLLE